MEDIEELWENLIEDFDFFISQKENFRESFLRSLGEQKLGTLGTQGIATLVDRLYLLLFTFQKDPREELYSLSYRLARFDIDLKKALLRASLRLVRDYVDYIVRSEKDYRRIKSLVDLIDVYLSVVEDAYAKYMEELRKKVKEERKEAEEKERRLLIEFLEKLYDQGKREVEILTYYKEVPLVYRSEILTIEEDRVRVKTSNVNIFKTGEEIYLKHKNLPQTVATEILDVDIPREEVLLKLLYGEGFRTGIQFEILRELKGIREG